MSDHEFWFSTRSAEFGEPPKHFGPAVWLRLERILEGYPDKPAYNASGPRKPVLLLHGASANHGSFTVGKPGLARWLYGERFDPWLLDWRGSSLVIDGPPEGKDNKQSLRDRPDIYNFNRAASEDLPSAITRMRSLGVEGPISLLGHCMGSAVVAEAVALGHVPAEEVDRIVLIALGLFYEAPIDSRLKSEERILERLTQDAEGEVVQSINPRIAKDGSGKLLVDWPQDLKNLYDAWPSALQPHTETPNDEVDGLCNRLSFMYGMPYHHQNLSEVIHGVDQTRGVLPEQFGAIPLRMYLHAARNLRRGHATFFPEDDLPPRNDEDLVSDQAQAQFRELEKVTLITGALNRLWHRDSVDRMHEWLCRGSSKSLRKFHKQIFANYAHQDLLWGEHSSSDVYPYIAAGLREKSDTPDPSSGIASAE